MEASIRAAFAIVGAVLGFLIGVLLALALGWYDKPKVLACGFALAVVNAGVAFLLARNSAHKTGVSRFGVAVLGLAFAIVAGWLLVAVIV